MHHANHLDPSAVVMVWIVFALLGVLYFLPTIVALVRHSPNAGMVIVVNLFLGWSLVGWVVALVLAVKPTQPQVVVVQQPVVYHPPQPPPQGPPGISS